MEELASAWSGLKTAYEIAKGLKDIDDRVKLNAAVMDLQERILSAQQAAMDAQARLQRLEAELAARDDWDATASRYELKNYGGHTFAYELRPDRANGEDVHRICPNCYQKRARSILQHRFRDASQREHFICPSCDKEFVFGVAVPIRVNRSGGPWA